VVEWCWGCSDFPLDSLATFNDAAGMSYPGGKNGAGVYQTIINLIPPHLVYIEPFLGGGAILRLKHPAALNIGIDLDSAAIARFSEAISGSRHSGRSGERARRPASKTAMGPGKRILSPNPAIPDRQFRFLCEDGISFLKSYPFRGDELVYCDPPYMMETRSRELYRFEMSDAHHVELLRVIKSLPCRVMISGYRTKLYFLDLASWNVTSFEAMTRGGHTATEYLWFNFPAPVALHDYRYLGANFRERERIKRKKLRWVNRLKRMPTLEKQCLLEAIASLAGSGDGGRRR
jgi:DNA adenine methylase